MVSARPAVVMPRGAILPDRRLAYVAGFSQVWAILGNFQRPWLLLTAGALTLSCAGLAGLEHGVLAIIGCAAAIAVLALGFLQPPPDFAIPWAVIPVPGFLIAFWAAERYRDGFRGRGGWRAKLGVFLDSVHLIRQLFTHPWRRGPALAGVAGFWLADAAAAWAGLAAFGYLMNPASRP
jgi:hypothetical protein